MKKRFLGIVVAILVTVLLTFSACMPQDNSDYDKQIEDLQKQIAELQQAIEAKNSEIEKLQEQLEELQNALEQKGDKNTTLLEQLKEQIRRVEETGECRPNTVKYTCTLDYAYENGFITREDIMHFSYYSYGVVVAGEKNQPTSEWVRIDFTPTEEHSALDEKAEEIIKYAYYVDNLEGNFYDEKGVLIGRPENYRFRNHFVTSDGYYIIEVMCPGLEILAHYSCAGIAWIRPNQCQNYFVFKY